MQLYWVQIPITINATLEWLLFFSVLCTYFYYCNSNCWIRSTRTNSLSRKVYKNRYKEKSSYFFINIGIHSVFQAVPFLFRSQYNSLGTSRKAAEAIDILIVPFIAFVYLYWRQIIKDHQRRSESVNRKITGLSSKILITVRIFYGIYAVVRVIHAIFLED